MKKKLFTSLILILLSFATFAQGEKEPYVVIKDHTATFYYNGSKPTGALPIRDGIDDENWADDNFCSSITKVVFDNSFYDYKPTSCKGWFARFFNLTEIIGMKDNLNTEDVTDMSSMFENCVKLTNINLSGFDTKNVTDMSSMFKYCVNLTNIDVTGFDTQKVTDVSSMFDSCKKLEELDLSSFVTTNVSSIISMFSQCINLKTIFVSENWSLNSMALRNSEWMFAGCDKLHGGQGTSEYDLEINDATYAKIDGGESAPGYLTKKGEAAFIAKEPYVIVKDNIATFYYNYYQDGGLPFQAFASNWPDDICKSITKCVIDESIKEYKPKTSVAWFNNLINLTEIEGLQNLNTENITSMERMFWYCQSLISLDLSSFNTAKVTDMSSMFSYCTKLQAIFVAKDWTTASVTESGGMFGNCLNLYGGKGSLIKTYELTDATYAKIDGGENDPGYLTQAGYAPFDPAYAVIENGTAKFYCDGNRPSDALPMRSDENDKNWKSDIYTTITQVVFDRSFKDYKPVKTSCWFWGFENLIEINGFGNINTENLEYMNEMFQFCDNLKSVDLSGFNTAKVTDMTRLFWGCNNLESIFVGDGWNISLVTKSSGMFEDCFKLYGGKGTAYNADKTDATYAKIDGGESTPGYLTKSGEPAFKKIVSIEITTMPKTDYLEGENFSDANGVITLTYHNGDKGKINLSDATISGFDKTKIGEQTLKVEYNGLETTLTVTVTTPTPVSDISDKESGIKVWSANSSIFIESTPDAKYKIIDLNGRILTTSTTKSSKEEIHINKQGVYVVLVNGDSFKVAIQ